jgi:hypothetical protein
MNHHSSSNTEVFNPEYFYISFGIKGKGEGKELEKVVESPSNTNISKVEDDKSEIELANLLEQCSVDEDGRPWGEFILFDAEENTVFADLTKMNFPIHLFNTYVPIPIDAREGMSRVPEVGKELIARNSLETMAEMTPFGNFLIYQPSVLTILTGRPSTYFIHRAQTALDNLNASLETLRMPFKGTNREFVEIPEVVRLLKEIIKMRNILDTTKAYSAQFPIMRWPSITTTMEMFWQYSFIQTIMRSTSAFHDKADIANKTQIQAALIVADITFQQDIKVALREFKRDTRISQAADYVVQTYFDTIGPVLYYPTPTEHRNAEFQMHVKMACFEYSRKVIDALERWILIVFGFSKKTIESLKCSNQPFVHDTLLPLQEEIDTLLVHNFKKLRDHRVLISSPEWSLDGQQLENCYLDLYSEQTFPEFTTKYVDNLINCVARSKWLKKNAKHDLQTVFDIVQKNKVVEFKQRTNLEFPTFLYFGLSNQKVSIF